MNIVDTIKAIFKKSRGDSSAPAVSDVLAADTKDLETTTDLTATQILADALKNEGFEIQQTDSHIALPSGIKLAAKFIESARINAENIRTSTFTVASHEHYFPDGLVEFQHSGGLNLEESLLSGFSSWAKMDLITLEDSVRIKPLHCSVMEMQLPEKEDTESLSRQVIFGPIGHLVTDSSIDGDSEHPFCPCCLFTNSFSAFRDLFESNRFVGIRLFASRSADGGYSADCRVNGEDFPLGVEQLLSYARSWPERGFEFRKQYVVIRQTQTSLNSDE